ncbi:unnamed protein product [Ilex paraguariensis]|uniref:FAD-binding PCMH-type domain-containing protein n=1 Tax=Ilex paraguariensis TaxID=185542 RepID=A0ABC8QP30_9AQUA
MKMISPKASWLSLSFVFLLPILSSSASSADTTTQGFFQCLSTKINNSTQVVYTPASPSYLSILLFSIQNLRFSTPSTPKPLAIITPLHESHVQAAICCSRTHNIEIRVRSGGHDYEGFSYVAKVPFAILDLFNLQSVSVNFEEKTVWVQAGATLGELYYNILNKSRTLAFPAGSSPSIGVGGHISGGGYGVLLRKFGLAVDHVIDARIVDVNGKILDRKSMGEDVFWAIRGGGGASFGVILAWKLNLVTVPEIVTFCRLNRTLENNATKLVHKWQTIADKVDENLFMRVFLRVENSGQVGVKTVDALFTTSFLGGIDGLLSLMGKVFPELGLARGNCQEVRWIDAFLFYEGILVTSLEELLNRTFIYKGNFKVKTDYVKTPLSESALEGLWERLKEEEVGVPFLELSPYGGKMSEISESATPFPHRAGNIYQIEYRLLWTEGGERHMNWLRMLYKYMAPYVSKNPREAYINYRDIDIGVNDDKTSYAGASIWGKKYFKNNFNRLVHAKSLIDPNNFFKNEQSIPSVI